MCVRMCVSVRLLVWFKDKYCIEKKIILSKVFGVTLTPATKDKTLLMLSSPEKKTNKIKNKKNLCKCFSVNLEAISPVTEVSTISDIKGLENGGEILEEMWVV